MLVVSRRTFAVPANVEAVLARLERLVGAKTMTLRPLREVDVDDLVRSFGVDPPGRLLVRLLYERSRGNPLYVREALRRIDDLDGFVQRNGRIETRLAATEFGAPADLRELVSLRLQGMDDAVMEALALAAVAGFEFDPSLLAQVGPTRVADHLAEASRSGLLSETSAGYRFTHPIIHAAVYDDIAPDRRRRHHRTLAAALDRLPDNQRREHLLEFAHHVLEGGLEDVPGRVSADLWQAGRRAADLAEWGEAARCYDGAIALAVREGANETHVSWMRYWSGRAHERYYDPETAVQFYAAALESGRRLQDTELWGRAALALATRTSVAHSNAAIGDYDQAAWDALVNALQHVTASTPALRAQLLCKYAEMQYQALDLAAGLEAAAEALELVRTGAPDLILVCESTLAYGHLAAGDAVSAVDLLAGVRDRIEPATSANDEGFALARLALAELALGWLDDALRTTQDAFVVFDSTRHHAGACMAQTIAADILLRQGQLSAGEAQAREAAQLYRISAYSQSPPVLYSALVAARSDAGDFQGARAALDAWSETGERGQGLARSLLAVRAGDLDSASAVRERAHRIMARAQTPSIVQIGQLGALAEIAAALDDTDLARQVLDALERRVAPEIVFAPGLPFHAAHIRATALRTLHSPEAMAATHEAVVATESTGVEPQAFRARAAVKEFSGGGGNDDSS
jgi:hypothetical protein